MKLDRNNGKFSIAIFRKTQFESIRNDVLTKNSDQRVSVIEAQKYLTERANEKGLKKDHIIYQEVVDFMRQGKKNLYQALFREF